MKSCTSAPEHIKSNYTVQTRVDRVATEPNEVPTLRHRPTASRRARDQPLLKFRKLSRQEIETGQVLLSRFIFHCGLPPTIISSPAFREFVQFLEPSFGFPAVDRLQGDGDLLVREVNRVNGLVDNKILESDDVVLSIDASSDGASAPLHHLMAISDGVPLLDRSIRSGTAKHSAEYSARQLITARDRINSLVPARSNLDLAIPQVDDVKEDSIEVKVKALVTDSNNAMRKTRRLFGMSTDQVNQAIENGDLEWMNDSDDQISEWESDVDTSKESLFAAYGCSFHEKLNVGSAILKFDEYKQLRKDASAVATPFRHGRAKQFLKKVMRAQGKLTENKHISIPAPGDTRSNSEIAMFRRLVKLKPDLILVSTDEEACEYLSTRVQRLVKSNDFWHALNCVIDRAGPVMDWGQRLQGSSSISEAFYSSMQCIEAAQRSGDNDVVAACEHHWNRISHRAHAACFWIDPRFVGVDMEPEDLEDAMAYWEQFSGSKWNEIRDKIAELQAKTGSFKSWRKYNFTTETPVEMVINAFKMLFRVKGCRLFAKKCISLLRMPATSAAVERTFSTVSRIHTKLRNRMSEKTLDRLVYIMYNIQVLGYKETSEWSLEDILL